jgi:pimeloyl-ACP methyl ester carboxylesterase
MRLYFLCAIDAAASAPRLLYEYDASSCKTWQTIFQTNARTPPRMAREFPGRVPGEDGTLIAYRGRRPGARASGVTVFVNGLSNENFQLVRLADECVARGRCALEFDFRGHGCSENPRDYALVSAKAFAKDAWACVDEFCSRSGVERERDVDLVSYSYGTQVALEMIRCRPAVIRCHVSLLGTPERILDGLVGRRGADVVVSIAKRVVGLKATSAVVGASLRFAATFPRFVWALSRVLGYLKSSYAAFAPFFAHLSRLDAECWVHCVVDGHENGAMDVLKDANRTWYCGMIEGDCDFAAPRRVVRSWERYCDFFVILPGVAHDGLRSHGDEIAALVRDVFERAEASKASSSNM